MQNPIMSFRARPALAAAIRAAAKADRRPPSQFLCNLIEDSPAVQRHLAAQQAPAQQQDNAA